MWRLTVEKGSDKGKKINISGDGSFVIGRHSSNRFPVQDALASRQHCRVISRNGNLYVQDLQSSHGTQVNFEKIDKKKLKEGDLVQVGNTELWVTNANRDPLLGQEIGGYMFHYLLGRGGQGVVYLAEQTKLQRICAVKVLDKKLVNDPSYRKSFISEARTAAALNHENLIGIYDIFEENDMVFFSMEHMSGSSIADKLSSDGHIELEDGLRYIIEAAQGLEYVHNKGYVHKDIKPANFMLDADDVLKIGDFGITSEGNDALKEGRLMGSPHFMSPEHILKKEMDHRTDLYSLGCSAYRILSGELPFVGKSVQEIVKAHIQQKAPSFKKAVPELGLKAAQVLERLMNKEPQNRFASAAQFIEALEKALQGGAKSRTGSNRAVGGSKTRSLATRKIFRRR